MTTRIFEMAAATIGGSFVGVRRVPFVAKQSMTPTASSETSAAFNAATNLVTIQADEDVFIAFGADPTATNSDFKVKAGEERDFIVGQGLKVAVKTS